MRGTSIFGRGSRSIFLLLPEAHDILTEGLDGPSSTAGSSPLGKQIALPPAEKSLPVRVLEDEGVASALIKGDPAEIVTIHMQKHPILLPFPGLNGRGVSGSRLGLTRR